MSSSSSVRPSPTSSLSSAGIPADPPLTQTSSPSGRVTSSSSLDGTTSACASPFFASRSCARPGTDARPSHRRSHLPDDLAAHLGRVLPRLCRALCRGASPFTFSTLNFSSDADLEPYAATGQPDHNLVSNVRRSSPSLSLSSSPRAPQPRRAALTLDLRPQQGYAQVVPHAHIHIVPAPTPSPSSSSTSTSTTAPTTPPSLRRLLGRDELDDAEGAELAGRIREELRREEDEAREARAGEGEGGRGERAKL